MSWRPITEADVLDGLSGPESSAYRTKLLSGGQTDPLLGIIAGVTAEVRDSIRSCERNHLDPDPQTVPAGTIHHAVAIIRHRLLTRLIGQISEARRDEWKTAVRYFERVASCDQAVADTRREDAAAPVQRPSMAARPREFTRRQQDGI